MAHCHRSLISFARERQQHTRSLWRDCRLRHSSAVAVATFADDCAIGGRSLLSSTGSFLSCCVADRGATTFSKLGVQCLGVDYCTEQNADGIPMFVHCRLLRNGNHTLHQKSWGGPFTFGGGGSGPHRPDPHWLRPWLPTPIPSRGRAHCGTVT